MKKIIAGYQTVYTCIDVKYVKTYVFENSERRQKEELDGAD